VKMRLNVFDKEKRPDLHSIQSFVLKDTDRVQKEITRTIPRDRHTGELHHEAISIKTWKKLKSGIKEDERHSVTLEGGEIDDLVTFIQSARDMPLPSEPGSYTREISHLTGISSKETLCKLETFTGNDRSDALALLLRQASEQPSIFTELLSRVADDPDFLAKAATAMNLVVYRKAVCDLELLIKNDLAQERDFQAILTENPWMFGSEYSHLRKKRRLTRDEQQDYLLTRTTDGYLEIVEIKTPLNGDVLFGYDKSHDTFYPKSDLSKVVAQVQHYLEEVDASRDSIIRRDGIDPNKVRAKIIIGTDGDQHQKHALRRTNGHLHRVEIITFDGLLRIAKQVLAYLEAPTA
jgi:hypothetical protein